MMREVMNKKGCKFGWGWMSGNWVRLGSECGNFGFLHEVVDPLGKNWKNFFEKFLNFLKMAWMVKESVARRMVAV